MMQKLFLRQFNKHKYIVALGTLLIGLGASWFLLKTWILEYLTPKLLILKPNTTVESFWHDSPFIISTDLYIFNWTNPGDFYNLSIKPKFEELGPYRFLQRTKKVNVVWNDNNTVTYNQVRMLHFDEDHTNGSLEDRLSLINVIPVLLAHHVRYWNYFFKRAISVFTVSNQVNIIKSANELLVAGYDHFIVNVVRNIPFIMPDFPRVEKYSMAGILNNSETWSGTINIGNGIGGDYAIRYWNYQLETSNFNGSCRKIRGSAGELFGRNLSKSYVDIFATDICRILRLEFEEEVIINNIVGYKYAATRGTMDNGTLTPENVCFCDGECIPSGMLNISACYYGAPLYVSLPHFYNADEIYLNSVEGLIPNKSKHEVYIVIEPVTGIPIKVTARLQANILVQPTESISLFQNSRRIYYPLSWVEQKFDPPYYIFLLIKIYLNASTIVVITATVFLTLGFLLLFFVFKPALDYFYLTKFKKSEHTIFKTEEVPLKPNIS